MKCQWFFYEDAGSWRHESVLYGIIIEQLMYTALYGTEELVRRDGRQRKEGGFGW